MNIPNHPQPSYVHKRVQKLLWTSPPTLSVPFYLLERNFSLFHNLFLPLRLSISPKAFPSAPIYLLLLRHCPFASVNTSDHHRNTFISQHLSIFFLPVVMVASRNIFVWPHLRFTLTPPTMEASCVTFAGINTSGHGHVFGHGCIWRQHLCHWASAVTFAGIWFPPLLLLESGFESLFFQIWWFLGFIVVVQRVFVHYSSLGQLFFLLLNKFCVRKSFF